MDINNIFSPARFGRLVIKYLTEDRIRIRYILVTSLVAVMVFAFFVGFMNIYNGHVRIDEELGYFTFLIVVLGLVITSGVFRSMSDPVTALRTLMVPASQFEGFLVRWIAVVPGFIIWMLLCCFFADAVRMLIGLILTDEGHMLPWGDIFSGSYAAVFWPENNLYYFLLTYFFSQSFFLLGSIVWKRRHFQKTFIALSFITLVYFLSGVVFSGFYGSVGNLSVGLSVAFAIIAIFVNYALTYLRFRESDIINRW